MGNDRGFQMPFPYDEGKALSYPVMVKRYFTSFFFRRVTVSS